MRIEIPPEHQYSPTEHLAEHYPSEILKAGQAFGPAPYRYSKLSLRELEGARYRTALINGCNVCINFRGARDFPAMFELFGGDLETSVFKRGPAPDEEYYQNVTNWKDYPGYSERERLAIRYAEGMGESPREIAQDEEFWTRAKAAFSDADIVDLTYSIAAWMGMGRAQHVLGLDTACSFAPVARAASTS